MPNSPVIQGWTVDPDSGIFLHGKCGGKPTQHGFCDVCADKLPFPVQILYKTHVKANVSGVDTVPAVCHATRRRDDGNTIITNEPQNKKEIGEPMTETKRRVRKNEGAEVPTPAPTNPTPAPTQPAPVAQAITPADMLEFIRQNHPELLVQSETASQPTEALTFEVKACEVEKYRARGYVNVYFSRKPEREVINELKNVGGFKWFKYLPGQPWSGPALNLLGTRFEADAMQYIPESFRNRLK